MAAASNGPSRRSRTGVEEVVVVSDTTGIICAGRGYSVSSCRSILNSPSFTQLRDPCLPKISTLASTNSLFCSICSRDCCRCSRAWSAGRARRLSRPGPGRPARCRARSARPIPCSRRRAAKMALSWTLAISSGEMFSSFSEMLGTSLFWPSTMPASYQPVWTSVILRSFSTSRARHPATSEREDETGRQPSAHAANCT